MRLPSLSIGYGLGKRIEEVPQIVNRIALWAQRLIGRYQDDYTNLAGSITLAITAAGASQVTATVLNATVNEVTTAGVGTGVMLPPQPAVVQPIVVANMGAHTLLVYPQVLGQINALGSNNPFSLTAGKVGVGWYASATQSYFGALA